MYWRRISTSEVPIEDPKAFEAWIIGQWRVKEEQIEYYYQNGHFPADGGENNVTTSDGRFYQGGNGDGYIETEVKLGSLWEISHIFLFLLSLGILAFFLAKLYNLLAYGTLMGRDEEWKVTMLY